MKHILVVEDDSFLNKMLCYNLAADGYGTLVYPEGVVDEDTYCMAMGPSEGMFAFYQAMNAMENLSDEELENFDAEDFSTYPTILTAP